MKQSMLPGLGSLEPTAKKPIDMYLDQRFKSKPGMTFVLPGKVSLSPTFKNPKPATPPLDPQIKRALALSPRDMYVKAMALMKDAANADERLQVARELVIAYIVTSIYLPYLKDDQKIIKRMTEMDDFWQRFADRNQEMSIVEYEDGGTGYLHEHWFRQVFAQEVAGRSELAEKAYIKMGWGDIKSYLDFDTADYVYITDPEDWSKSSEM